MHRTTSQIEENQQKFSLLGAKHFQIGLLNSLPQLFGSVVQLKSTEISEGLKSRVKPITLFVILQALTWLIIPIGVFIPGRIRIGSFVLFIIINTLAGAISTPVWASLMSDPVDKTKYGEYFSWRGKVLGLINLVSNFVAGILLSIIKINLQVLLRFLLLLEFVEFFFRLVYQQND